MTDDDLLMCNCAGCGAELLGRGNVKTAAIVQRIRAGELPEYVAGHMAGRPYCRTCLALKDNRVDETGRQLRGGKTLMEEDEQPTFDDVVKLLEG